MSFNDLVREMLYDWTLSGLTGFLFETVFCSFILFLLLNFISWTFWYMVSFFVKLVNK